jgi:hypothetical protein
MAKLHELNAIKPNLSTQGQKARADLMATFSGKRHLFEASITTFRSNTEGGVETTEEQSEIQSTVADEIKWFNSIFAKYLDVVSAIENGNTTAKADLVAEDSTVLLQGVPATCLLQLEKHLQAVRELAVVVPTLDPAKGYRPDPDKPTGVFKARDITTTRTQKRKEVLVKFPATDKHPAQTEVYDADVAVGTILKQHWSALTTPKVKAEFIGRIDSLIRSVKKALSKANEVDVDFKTTAIGEKLLNYAFAPLFEAKTATK